MTYYINEMPDVWLSERERLWVREREIERERVSRKERECLRERERENKERDKKGGRVYVEYRIDRKDKLEKDRKYQIKEDARKLRIQRS